MKKQNKYKLVKKKGRVQIVIDSLKGQNLNRREVEDIQNGLVDYALPMEVNIKKKSFTLTYDITNYIPLNQYIHTLVNRKKYVEIVLQILQVFQKMTDGYYNPQNLVLELDKVMVNPSMNKILFVFVPILYFNCQVTTKEFLTQLTYHTTFDNSEDTSYVEKSLEILLRNINFSAVELEEYLQSLEPEEQMKNVTESKKNIPAYSAYDAVPAKKTEKKVVEKRQMVENRYSDGEVNNSRHDKKGTNPTVMLAEGELSYIKQVRTGEQYFLRQDETKIGKRDCHIEVTGNPAISKFHAIIHKIDGKCYLVDAGSTNGTKVQGEKITPWEKVLLKDEAVFELADEKFIFYA